MLPSGEEGAMPSEGLERISADDVQLSQRASGSYKAASRGGADRDIAIEGRCERG
jgi:hypothetical protein